MTDTAPVRPHVSAPGHPRPVTPSTILATRMDRLATRLADIPGLDRAVLVEVEALARLAGGLDPYLDRNTSPASDALDSLARRTATEDWNGSYGNGIVEQEMLSGHVEGQFLQTLIHLAQARTVLDIGMFTGYSALAMAEALPQDGKVVACEIDPKVAEFARRCLHSSPDGDKVDVRVGPASDTLDALAAAGEQFELVFLDADKAGYGAYLDAVLDAGLLAARGVVVVDNTLMQGQPWAEHRTTNGAAIADFNAKVAADPRVAQVMLPLRDGITLIRPAKRS